MRWATPWAWLLIIPLIIAFWWNFFRKEKFKAALQFSSLSLIKTITPGLKAQFAFLPNMLKLMALGCAIMAMARPQASNSKVNRNVEGIDIMVVFDVSDSMEIEDMQPDNRITAAKSVIHKFIKGRTSDRIGLIIFAAESYTRSPLTLDYETLLQSLDTVTTDNIKQGTAIGVALANGVARLKDSSAKSRVMILLTDGENNSGTIDPETATEIAKGYGIKIYTIGVGVNGQAQLPTYIKDAFGNKVKTYQPIHSTVNMDLLDKIAKETGGQSFRAVDTDALKGVFASIDKLEKTKIEVSQYVRYTELFPSWLKMGVIFYLAQLVLSLTFLRRVP
jgi:Ca-activated chloride channel family protein